MSSPESQDLLEQLLAEEATQGLSHLETLELERLLEELGTSRAEYGYEHAAAALEVAFHAAQTSDIPASLHEGLDSLAQRASHGGDLLEFPTSSEADAPAPPEEEQGNNTALWLLAAAAAIALLGLSPRLFDRSATEPVETPVATVADDQLRIDFAATEDAAAAGASGQVVWSTSAQQGEMLIAGLEVNDPSVAQYQLWIFDAEQDERYPIDGGVFDIVDGEAVVPIDAKLQVRSPTLFAITVEPPGGVVVSSRERIVLLAPVA